MPLDPRVREGGGSSDPQSQETCHVDNNPPVGETGKGGTHMTTKTIRNTAVAGDSRLGAIFAVLAFGTVLLFAAGYAQATALHDAAHDQRHAMAFPCH
jgi:cobalt transporter subunit CbtB